MDLTDHPLNTKTAPPRKGRLVDLTEAELLTSCRKCILGRGG
jgi:hypothetical protein